MTRRLASPQLTAGDSRPFRHSLQLSPHDRGMNAPIQPLLSKTAIDARDDILTAHHAGESEYPLGHQLRMFHHVRSVADNPGRQQLALGQLDVLPDLPLVLVPGLCGFDEVSAGPDFEDENGD